MSLDGGKLERRALELGAEVVEVMAPAGWTDARVEAWLDWAQGDPDLPAAIFRYAEGLVQQGQRLGIFDGVGARGRFRRDLGAALLGGRLALRRVTPAKRQALQDGAELLGALAQFRAEHRQRRLAAAAGEALARRLQGVVDAVPRCEGDQDACADPQRNPTLARACDAARQAGASDAAILEAVTLARAGETRLPTAT
ncbi:MAG: ribonucleotide reductase, partial [Caulobacteraceae bacterium]|nr:ribonucleotide reductase [Caulobacteraceae bacterium]